MSLMKNFNTKPPDMLKSIFALFDVSKIFDGPYFFTKYTNYDLGDYTEWSSPSGYRDSNMSTLFAHNINPVAMIFII